jgi:lipopolysaccharide transport system permease protein
MILWFGIQLSWSILALPLFLLLALCTALATGLWLSALNVRFRDVGHTIPFLVQVWMYTSPIVYSASVIPERYRFFYSLNPMVGVIEGFRWALLRKESPDFAVMTISSAVVLLLIIGGVVFFRNMESTFADVV